VRVLVVHCHPNPTSFTAAARDCVVTALTARGGLYARLARAQNLDVAA
jgi:putative NADPH-quinone reductase